jgi:hypothetical protein
VRSRSARVTASARHFRARVRLFASPQCRRGHGCDCAGCIYVNHMLRLVVAVLRQLLVRQTREAQCCRTLRSGRRIIFLRTRSGPNPHVTSL